MRKSILAILLALTLAGCASQSIHQTSLNTGKKNEKESVQNQFYKALVYYNKGDYKNAFKLYQKAANQGDGNSQYNLGIMYDDGDGVIQDDKKAVYWYKKAANQGYALAQVKIGIMYTNGRGVIQDDKQAFYWNRKAASQGNSLAQANVGFMYLLSRGVKQNYKLAEMWGLLAKYNGLSSVSSLLSFTENKLSQSQIESAQVMARKCLASNYIQCH